MQSGNKAYASKNDSVCLSLITCAPGNAIWSLFGHTAIRYKDPSRGIDVVFNYGVFDFNKPHFIWRFILGQTDYQMGADDYNHFINSYAFFNRSVWQQTLNLTPTEKEKLINLLEINYQPQNRYYRYNFFYDNCATRPRNVIEECINGRVFYNTNIQDVANASKSYRDIVHQFTKGHPWARFGIDLCLGNEADLPINYRSMMFAPYYLRDFFAQAKIDNGKVERPLTNQNRQLLNADSKINKSWQYPTPLQSALLLFVLTIISCIISLKRKRTLWAVDIVLFGSAGITGCILAFLVLFSEHPTVGSNYLLFIFHPGHLLFLPYIIYCARKKKKSIYHLLNAIDLTLFIVFLHFIPQKIDLAVIPLALCLLIRSLSNLILTYKKQNE
ncbi:MAG: DUF4105 domain-containing protein [Bacteroidaceae bacterium]|nr:DUF4105 domain-containing protein [Bacteroidaceae bacterium]